MDGASDSTTSERLLLHGMTDARAADIIGPCVADFAGVPVRAIRNGSISALVSAAPPRPRLPAWLSRIHKPKTAAPVLSALATIMPFLPAAPRTLFETEASLRGMMSARETELSGFVEAHAQFLECDLSAGFAARAAEEDLSSNGPLAFLRGETDAEQALIQRSLTQSVNGRKAMFLARLSRRINEDAIDTLATAQPSGHEALRRKVLIERHARAEFRAVLRSLADEAGLGAWLRMGPFMPPVSFRRIEISSADVVTVSAARAALGIEEAAERASIRIAYHRTLERCYPHVAEEERHRRLAHLESLYRLLDRIAEGQLRAGRTGSLIRFDASALKETWLLRLHKHDLADRAA